MEQVLARNPVDAGAVQDVVNRIAWLSEVYLQAGDSKMRMRLLLRGVQLVDKLRIDDPGNNDLTDVWLTFQLGLMKMDETASPVQLKAALNAARDLVRDDPTNRVWRKRLQNLVKLN